MYKLNKIFITSIFSSALRLPLTTAKKNNKIKKEGKSMKPSTNTFSYCVIFAIIKKIKHFDGNLCTSRQTFLHVYRNAPRPYSVSLMQFKVLYGLTSLLRWSSYSVGVDSCTSGIKTIDCIA